MKDRPESFLIATRGSALALAQANTVLARCRAAFPGLCFDLRIIKTTGDKLQTASLASSELPKGLFTKEIEEALRQSEADLAVHSLKDLPTQLPDGLALGAVLNRADVRDVLVFKATSPASSGLSSGNSASPTSPLSPALLRPGATVATSSTRRRAQLLDLRPDLCVVPIRGNVDTRLRKLAEQTDLDATILAAAGLHRLGFEINAEGFLIDHRPAATRPLSSTGRAPLGAAYLASDEMLPCVGQAAIGIESRTADERLVPILRALDDPETHFCVAAERAFLTGMGGGCQLAVAAYARVEAGRLILHAVSFLGPKPQRGEIAGPPAEALRLGQDLAKQLASPA
jgi:hydroxymethylbilane synthase